MYVVLVQKDVKDSSYKDIPFRLYHFPKRNYAVHVQPGYRFIYYRSEQHAPGNSHLRYYFGAGVIGRVWDDPHQPDHAFAEIASSVEFRERVPLKMPNGEYFESLGRHPKKVAWTSAVRVLSPQAYRAILAAAGLGEAFTEVAATSGQDTPSDV